MEPYIEVSLCDLKLIERGLWAMASEAEWNLAIAAMERIKAWAAVQFNIQADRARRAYAPR